MADAMPDIEISDAEMPVIKRKRVREPDVWSVALTDSWNNRTFDAQKQMWKGKGKNTKPLATERPDPTGKVTAKNRSEFDLARDAVRRSAAATEVDGVQLGVRTVVNVEGCESGTARLHFYATAVQRMTSAVPIPAPQESPAATEAPASDNGKADESAHAGRRTARR